MEIKTKIEQLRNELNQHNYNYYVLDNPTISDYEFDLKIKELQDLEKNILSFSMKIPQRFAWVEL